MTSKEALKKTKEEKRLSVIMPYQSGRKFDECLRNNGDMKLINNGKIIKIGKFKELSKLITKEAKNVKKH